MSHAIETVGSHADLLDHAQQALWAWPGDHESNDRAVQARFQGLG